MADSEFEQFRQYFDQLPQYIKAPAHCYSLVPNIDFDAEEFPTNNNNSQSTTTQGIPTILIPSVNENSTIISINNDRNDEEPFSGDLQMMPSLENEENLTVRRIVTQPSTNNTGTVTRKRRKLPEVPKRKIDGTQNQKCNVQQQQSPRQLSLAEELLIAEQNIQSMKEFQDCNVALELPASLQIPSTSTNYSKDHCHKCSSYTSKYVDGNSILHITDSSAISGYRNGNKGYWPSYALKSGHGSSSQEDESSSDSEKYPSLDSGHSTIHSDDGLIKYSSQILSMNESFSPSSPTTNNTRIPISHLEVLEATHRGLHKFIPRHHDEVEVDIGDPIYVQKEADDLWCEGVNLRTGLQGIFPSAYVVDVEYNDFDPSANKVKKERYLLNYLGSIETLYHKGNEVMCQAVKKIAKDENYVTTHARACILEISDQGIHMADKGKLPPNHTLCHDYFYALKNVSFCGFHPTDHRYFCFVTKHPTFNRFACHVFISDESTRPVAEAVGRAFQRFYQKFLETAYPIEDIYLE